MSGPALRAAWLMAYESGWVSCRAGIPGSIPIMLPEKVRHAIAKGMADAILAGPFEPEACTVRLADLFGARHRWLKPFSKRLAKEFGAVSDYGQRDALIQFIRRDTGYLRACEHQGLPRIRHPVFATATMGRMPESLSECSVPALATSRDLAAWLGLSLQELAWYADTRGMIKAEAGKLSHYRYLCHPKRQGGYRLIESPKDNLRRLQQKILHQILDSVPPHPAAHGFRRGHSCLSFAAPHVGQHVVLRMDLDNFFGNIPARRVQALFQTLGYPMPVARYLTGLCTHRVPYAVFKSMPGFATKPNSQISKILGGPHLPQGAPTSPALANLCAWRMDLRLAALCAKTGVRYTRYADDLAFSGDENLRRGTKYFAAQVAVIACEEGFSVNFRKTRIMPRCDRQTLTGIVVNEKINLQRADYDQLKAILCNCVRFGAEPQNRQGHHDFKSHLLGRVNYLKQLNPSRGMKLQTLFEQISWQG